MVDYKKFDRSKLRIRPLSARVSKTGLSVMIDPSSEPPKISDKERQKLHEIAQEMREKRPIVISYGAHLIKNGGSPLLIKLMEQGYVQHLMTNGAGMIHDFELAYQGRTEEDVAQGLREGQFGLWNECSMLMNGCIANERRNIDENGVGKSIGDLISRAMVYSKHSVIGRAYELGIPISVMKAFGQDIIDMHPTFDGAAWGRAIQIDFDILAKTIQGLQGGMFFSIGSSVMSPMVFEKALAMARNTTRPENFHIVVNDIQPSGWDWSKGEPPKDNPSYFLRFNKTFSRAARACNSKLSYIQMDNRAFLHNLYIMLSQ